jgi:hypothetical protein
MDIMKKTIFILLLGLVSFLISCQTKNKTTLDSEFDKRSTITTLDLSPTKIEDLTILGKVWGFLKYYHPTVAKGDLNWDYELFRIMPKIIQGKTDRERNEILSKWIRNLGNVKKGTSEKIDDSSIKLKPDLTWITDISKLGEELSRQLINIRDSKRDSNNYYVRYFPKTHIPEFTNEKQYSSSLTESDAGYRLLSLYRYWNIVQYYFPYKNLIEENWNDVMPEFIPEFVNSTSDLEYELTVLSLISRIHDTHARLEGHNLTFKTLQGNNYAPVIITFIENKAVVRDYLDKLLGKKSGLKIGDVIDSINHKSIDEIINKKLPITSASNYPEQLRLIGFDLLRTNDSILEITIKRGNKLSSFNLKCFSMDKLGQYADSHIRDTCFKLITTKIAYIFPGTIKNEYLPNIMAEVTRTKGLIIDMRCYPSDFIVFSFAEYLMPDSTAFVKFSGPSIINPGLFAYYKTLKVGKSNTNYYKGKVVIIVNELTMSNAEYTTMAFQVAPKATVIGSQTAGADGNAIGINLPGGIVTGFSSIGVYYPDGRETQRIGIVPDIEIKPTIKGIIEGKDELLEKAVALINKK